MAKLTVWECDHCSVRSVQCEWPANWVEAKVYGMNKADNIEPKTYLWCGTCMNEIKSHIPTKGF